MHSGGAPFYTHMGWRAVTWIQDFTCMRRQLIEPTTPPISSHRPYHTSHRTYKPNTYPTPYPTPPSAHTLDLNPLPNPPLHLRPNPRHIPIIPNHQPPPFPSSPAMINNPQPAREQHLPVDPADARPHLALVRLLQKMAQPVHRAGTERDYEARLRG